MGTRGACVNSNTNLNGSLSEEDIQVFQALVMRKKGRKGISNWSRGGKMDFRGFNLWIMLDQVASK